MGWVQWYVYDITDIFRIDVLVTDNATEGGLTNKEEN